MENISWGAHLLAAALFLVTAWTVLTSVKPVSRSTALAALTVASIAAAWAFSLWVGLLLAITFATMGRWVYRQSRALSPADLYRWL